MTNATTDRTVARRRRKLPLAVLPVLILAALLGSAGSAHADFGLQSFSAELHEPFWVPAPPLDPAPPLTPATQAGAHPDFTVDFNVNTHDAGQGPVPDEQVKNIDIDLPPGLYGNPEAVPQCAVDEFLHRPDNPLCPADTQVGLMRLRLSLDPTQIPNYSLPAPIYNMEAPEGELAMFAMAPSGVTVTMFAKVRTDGDYGIRASIKSTNTALSVYGATTTLWGIPADPIHDNERLDANTYSYPGSSDAPRRAFLSAPAQCDRPLVVGISVNSWQDPAETVTASHQLAPRTGCERLRFEPEVDVTPASSAPGTPTGLEVLMSVPQEDSLNDPVTPQLRDAVVTLPEGMSISPSAADGLQACSDAQIGAGSDSEPACPEASKVGTVEVVTPLLADPLVGDVVLGTPKPGQMFRLWLVVRGPGLLMKLPGTVDPDPQTGQLTTKFENTPELPFSTLKLKLNGGSRGLLANPTSCGEKTATAELTSWSADVAPVLASSTFAIDCPGVSGFAPSLMAGTTSPVGGAFSPFAVRINRSDADQYLSSLSLELPRGVSAKLAGVPLCSEAAVSAGSCDPGSRVGTATVGAGPGSNPFYLQGGVFLTGPYKGAPYGLATIVRALAGPYDLGTVVVRQALHVDPTDAHVTVKSDQFPTILEGVPLRLRSINVDVDRPGFTLNPTSCAEKQIQGTLTSTEGASSSSSQRFQVGDCSALAFTPKLALRLTGKAQRKPGGHPGLRAVMTQPAGQANLKQVKVKLPSSLALDAKNAAAVCDYDQSLQANCPDASKIGDATAYTPILNRPLSGPVYLVQGIRFDPSTGARIRTLPTLLAKLRGDVAINLRATNSVSGKKLVSTFPTIPDVPVSKFSLRLHSGTNGILAVTGGRNLCRQPRTAAVETDGQNGKRADYAARMKAPCPKKKRR